MSTYSRSGGLPVAGLRTPRGATPDLYPDLTASYTPRSNYHTDIPFSSIQSNSIYSPGMNYNSPLLPIAGGQTTLSYPTSPAFLSSYNPVPSFRQQIGGVHLTPTEFNRRFSPDSVKNVRLNGRGEAIRKQLRYVGVIDGTIIIKDSQVKEPRTLELLPIEILEINEMGEQLPTPAKLQYKLKRNVMRPVLLKSPVRGLRNVEITKGGKLKFDTQGILQMPTPSYDRPPTLRNDAGYIVHYDDPSIESKLNMMRMKLSTKRDITSTSMELDQMEMIGGRENFRVKGNEEVEINRDSFVVDIREVTVDRLRAVKRAITPNIPAKNHMVL